MCARMVDRTPEPGIHILASFFGSLTIDVYLLQFFHVDGVDVAVGEGTDMDHTLA